MRKAKSIKIVGQPNGEKHLLSGRHVKVIALLENGEEVDISNPTSDLTIHCDLNSIVTAECCWLVSDISLDGIEIKEKEERT